MNSVNSGNFSNSKNLVDSLIHLLLTFILIKFLHPHSSTILLYFSYKPHNPKNKKINLNLNQKIKVKSALYNFQFQKKKKSFVPFGYKHFN